MSRIFAWLSCAFLVQISSTFMAAQTPPAPAPVGRLNIVVLEGAGGINNIRQHTGQTPSIRVEDEDKQPIAGAIVVFTLPSQGPSGSFMSGDKTLTATTDTQGQVSARGLKPNAVAGQMDIGVNASYQGRTARATITQFNMEVPGAKKGSSKTILIIAIVGAAAAGGAVAGLHKGSSSTPTSASIPAGSISITPGTATVGPPQ